MSEKSDQKPDQGPSPIGEISQEPSSFEAFLDANQKRLLIVGILAVLGLVGYVIVTGLQKKAKLDASAAVSAGRTVPDYESLSKEYEGEAAGGAALLYKSQLLWGDKLEDEAVSTLEEFISKYPEHPAFGSALTTLGSYQMQLEKIDAAKDAFTKAAETKSATSSWALLSLGDLALQEGEDADAKAYYERIVDEYESNHPQVKSFAQARLKLIGVKPPVQKAPEPPKPAGPPTPTGKVTPPATFPGITPGNPQPFPARPATVPTETPKPTEKPKPVETPEPTESTEPTPATGTTSEDLPDLPELDIPEKPAAPAEPDSAPE